jgi:hypothetical protein
MSTALAISGVSAVLEGMLSNVYSTSGLVPVPGVTAKAPDLVQAALGSASDSSWQVNLFLHQVTFNAAWRNVCQPSLGPDGSTRLATPPLALDLHYLLTAYASDDCEAEALLGYAIQMMHETPILPRATIRAALQSPAIQPPGNPIGALLASSGLADQFELIKIIPATLGREELAWLWTALKADYRPTFPFQVSVVLIEAPRASSAPLPVLQRAVTAQPNLRDLSPTITEATPLSGQPAAALGETVSVTGSGLTGATSVSLVNARLGVNQTLTPLAAVGSASFTFTIPNPALPPPQPNPTDLPAGVYLLSATVQQGSDDITTNGVPLAIAPSIGSAWAPGTIASGAGIAVTIPCAPYIRPGQQASLLIGDQSGPADPITTPTNSPTFIFPNLQPTGRAVPVRLRVDGIDSRIIDLTTKPPSFLAAPSVQVT